MADAGVAEVRAVRVPGETWVWQVDADGRLTDILFRRDAAAELFGSIHMARLGRRGKSQAVATLTGGVEVWLDPPPATCALTGRAATEGALIAVQVVEEARPGKLARASGRIAFAGRRLILLAGEAGRRLSHRIVGETRRKSVSSALAGLPGGSGAWLATMRAEPGEGAEMAGEAEHLVGRLAAAQRQARMAGAPAELVPATEPLAECLAERLGSMGAARLTVNTGSLRRSADAAVAEFGLAERVEVELGLSLAAPWEDPAVADGFLGALEPVVPFDGGRLHIEPTQALVAIDIDGDPARGFAEVNKRAAGEVARQLRLRGLGGLLVVDPVGPATARTARAFAQVLERQLAGDPFTSKVEQGGAGLVTVVRERRRPALADRLAGEPDDPASAPPFVPSVPTAAHRALATALRWRDGSGRAAGRLELPVAVAQYLTDGPGRPALDEARGNMGVDLAIVPSPDMRREELVVSGEGGHIDG